MCLSFVLILSLPLFIVCGGANSVCERCDDCACVSFYFYAAIWILYIVVVVVCEMNYFSTHTQLHLFVISFSFGPRILLACINYRPNCRVSNIHIHSLDIPFCSYMQHMFIARSAYIPLQHMSKSAHVICIFLSSFHANIKAHIRRFVLLFSIFNFVVRLSTLQFSLGRSTELWAPYL